MAKLPSLKAGVPFSSSKFRGIRFEKHRTHVRWKKQSGKLPERKYTFSEILFPTKSAMH